MTRLSLPCALLPVLLLAVLLPWPALAGSAATAAADLRTLAGPAAVYRPAGPIPAADDPLVHLGAALFFSRSLSGQRDVACASCHHPLLGGGDALSLPVGEAAADPALLGPGRRHSTMRSADPRADGLPNVPRNSPTVFNSGLYSDALFLDGRVVQAADGIVTPDSAFGAADPFAGADLLTAQTRFPVTSAEEMRGFTVWADASGRAVRAQLVARLRTDPHRLGGASGWRRAFAQVFGADEPVITFARINQALAAYQASQHFMASPWQAFLAGEDQALDAAALRGGLLFHTPAADGGAGCARCHHGPLLTDEGYHNLAMPQFGRGKGRRGADPGREGVTRRPTDRFAFRTPSLTNVAATGPWGHSGAFASLAATIRHHLDPAGTLAGFDWRLAHLPQFRNRGSIPWPDAATNSATALAALPSPPPAAAATLEAAAIADLVAFLDALSDPCVRNADCLAPWLPANLPAAFRDPDGWTLGARFQVDTPVLASGPAGTLPDAAAPPLSAAGQLPGGYAAALLGASGSAGPAPDLPDDPPPRGPARLLQGFVFEDITSAAGLDVQHQLPLLEEPRLVVANQQLYMASGVAAADLTGDGLPELLFTAGGGGGETRLLRNTAGHFSPWPQPALAQGGHQSGPGFADLDGDADLDLVIGGIRAVTALAGGLFSTGGETWDITPPRVLRNDGGTFVDVTAASGLHARRNVFGVSFGDPDLDGDLDLFLAHWDANNAGEDDHLWLNDGSGRLRPGDAERGLQGLFSPRDFSFTAHFTDLDGDTWPEVLVAADFLTSRVLGNRGDGHFDDITDPAVVTDQNGMGAAVGDFDGDLDMDWFVTSIHDPRPERPLFGSWGISGNRYYENRDGRLVERTGHAGVRDGNWGWAACAGDLDLDGDLDLVQATGFGDPRTPVFASQTAPFLHAPLRLFLNDGDGRFREGAAAAGLAHSGQARALICTDTDGDGDLDVVVASSNGPARLFANRLRERADRPGHWLVVTLAGACGNTAAIGARVELSARNGQGQVLRQVREIRAGSSFASQEPALAHFGLADHSEALDLLVRWPLPGGPQSRHRIPGPDRRVHISAPAAVTAQCLSTGASTGR